MLYSLIIKNYRNLKELRITSLGRVNLITGKNNTGKSTILEAIAIYAAKGDLKLIYQLLEERGEYFRQTADLKNPTEYNIKVLSSLFTNRFIGFDENDAISIGSIGRDLFGESSSSEESVSLKFVKYFEDIQTDKQATFLRIKRYNQIKRDSAKHIENFKVGLETIVGIASDILPLDSDRPYRLGFKDFKNKEPFQFIGTRSIDRALNGKLFDNIALTEKEHFVIDALKIIEPETERIAFVEESSRERNAVIKLSNNQGVFPLQSMGDGINSILTIILASVNADNGYLLIDEFENGLHYTVQEQLWKIIFSLSQKLNVQVFVTTHSEDSISSFEKILNSPDNSVDGKLIRLDNENGTIKQVEFNAKELKIANDNDIEIR